MKNINSDQQRLIHIIEAINQIEIFVHGVNYGDWKNNLMLRLAITKLLENIGEATAAISPELKKEFPQVEWQVLKNVRNVLIHEYFGIDYDIVWESIKNDIPLLKEKVMFIMSSQIKP